MVRRCPWQEGRSVVILVGLLAGLVIAGLGVAPAAHAAEPSVAETAYPLLVERANAHRTGFFVYRNADGGFNHGFPSGLFASSEATLAKIHTESACVDDGAAADGCSDDPDALDRDRGTVFRVMFDPLSAGEFAGLHFEEPEGWGSTLAGSGFTVTAGGDVTFRAGSRVLLRDGFSVGGGASFRALIDPTLR